MKLPDADLPGSITLFGSKCHEFVQEIWKGITGAGMIIILLSDQDLILGLLHLVVRRMTGGRQVQGRMVGVLMIGGIIHIAGQRVLEVMVAVPQDLVHGHTVLVDWP